MGVKTTLAGIDEEQYSKLLSKALPKIIENDDEFDRMVQLLEELEIPERQLSREEEALAELLTKLVMDYDDQHYSIPDAKPHEMVGYLMEQRNLKQADLVPVLGTRAQVSEIVSGKRGISKAQAKKLAGFFKVSVELFI